MSMNFVASLREYACRSRPQFMFRLALNKAQQSSLKVFMSSSSHSSRTGAGGGDGLVSESVNRVANSSDVKEKLYIFDGTSMLYTSYFSKECQTTRVERRMSATAGATIGSYLEHIGYGPLDNCSSSSSDKSSSKTISSPLSSVITVNNYVDSNPMGNRSDLSAIDNNTIGVDSDLHNPSSNGLYYMALNFLRFVQEYNPRYVAIAFDHRKTNFRHSLYPQYKQNRGETPKVLLHQLAAAPLIFHSLGCRCFKWDNYEADDVMATLGAVAKRSLDLDVVYVSPDKDMLQLVTDPATTIIQPMTRRLVNMDNMLDVSGVLGGSFCDFQVLAGDAADNIPGVKGIGPKIAAALMNHYHSIDALYNDIDTNINVNISINSTVANTSRKSLSTPTPRFIEALKGVRCSPEKVLKSLLSISRETLLIYRDLVTLRNDLELFDVSADAASIVIDKSIDIFESSTDGQEKTGLNFDALIRQVFHHHRNGGEKLSEIYADYFKLQLALTPQASRLLDRLGLETKHIQKYINNISKS